MPGLIRVGHKGADHVAPGNTVESFEAALEHGVDMIEFDVLRTRDGRLVLAHDYADSERRECLTLEEGLEHFAGEAYAGVELDVDLKLPGYEADVVDGLARHGLTERSLVSTMYVESLDRLGELGAGHAARLVGAARPAQLPRGASARAPARLRDGGLHARPHALARLGAHPLRRLRGDHGPPDPGRAAAWCEPSRARAGSSTCGPSTRRRRSGPWRPSAWTA